MVRTSRLVNLNLLRYLQGVGSGCPMGCSEPPLRRGAGGMDRVRQTRAMNPNIEKEQLTSKAIDLRQEDH